MASDWDPMFRFIGFVVTAFLVLFVAMAGAIVFFWAGWCFWPGYAIFAATVAVVGAVWFIWEARD